MAVDTITDALDEAISIKGDIRTSIINRGVAVPADTPFEDYPDKIDLIKGIRQTKTLMPTAAGGTVEPDSGYDGFSAVTLPAEPNLIAANISEGVSIFGVTGNAQTATFDITAFFARTLTSLSLGVTSLGNYAMYKYASLQTFTDTSLATLGEYAFYECTGLTSFTASASLTELKQYAFYGCTNLATFDLSHIVLIRTYALYNCNKIANIGTLTASKIEQYGAYSLGSSAASGFKYIPNVAAEVDDYALRYAKITEVSGEFSKIGAYALADLGSQCTKIDVEVNGPLGNYGLYNNQYAKTVDFSEGNITNLGQYALYYLGWNRSGYSSDPYMELDFRNSSFKKVDQYSLGYTRYANIYMPTSVNQIESYAFYGCQNINLYMTGKVPTLASTAAFNGASNYKVFAPWTHLVSYTSATNWSSIASNIVGYAPAGTFTAGDTLPAYNAEGYAMTWYSDAAKTTQVTTCPAGSPILYCAAGATKEKQVVVVDVSGPITLAILDSNSNPVDISNGFFLCENGDVYSINATATQQGYVCSVKINGTKVTTFPYTLTIGSTDVTIEASAYDPSAVNPDFVNATWLEIKNAVTQGLAVDLYAEYLGATKEVELSNGQTIHVRLANNTADMFELADGSGTTGFVLEFVELLNTTYPMNQTSTNEGGWNASYMKTTVMPLVFNMLPSDLQEVITTVKRQTCYSGTDGTLVTSEDKLFLPVERNVFASRSYSRTEEWNVNTRYQYYTQNDTAQARIKTRNGSADNWWLSSVYENRSGRFVYVYNYGNANYTTANTNSCVGPSFCL